MPLVYQATNTVNGKRYIGVTMRALRVRQQGHYDEAAAGGKRPFCAALRKYGRAAFEWTVLEEHATDTEALAAEVRLIAEHKPEYNIAKGGKGTGGLEWSEESKRKLSATITGRKLSEESKIKIANSHKGIGHGPEARAKIGAASRGRKLTLEQRGKLSTSLRGRVVSEETRRKIGTANKGRFRSPDAIEKSAVALRGKKQSPEHVAKRAAALKGREITVEHRAKISAANKGKRRTAAQRAKMSIAQTGVIRLAARGKKRSPEAIAKVRAAGLVHRDEWLARSHLGPAASAKSVICVDDGLVYPSASAAARAYNVAKSALIEMCLGQRRRQSVGGMRFMYHSEGQAT